MKFHHCPTNIEAQLRRKSTGKSFWVFESLLFLRFSLFGNHILMFHMHQSIMNHFGTMTPILLGSDALLVLLLVILLHVLSDNKVMGLIQRHMKHWCVMFI